MSHKASPGQEQPLLHGTPPPYGAPGYQYHGQHQGVMYVPHGPSVPVIVQPPSTVVVVRERPRCRFCKALVWAIAAWLVLGIFMKGLVTCTGWTYGTPRQWAIGPGNASPDYPIPRDIEIMSCEEPLKTGRANQTSFQIPSSSDTVLLLVEGRLLHGSVRLTTTSARTDSVKFTVNLSPRRNLPVDTIACVLKRKDGEHGIGIFNPTWKRFSNIVRYDIVVEFPENHPIIKRFDSSIINAVYEIDDLQGKILFEALRLHTTNGGINSKSFYAQWADITTSNGRIEGKYNVSDFLLLHTSNGRIDVDVTLNQDASDKAALSMITTNAALEARLNLKSLTSPKSGSSSFDVTGRTTNAHLNVAFYDAPVDSTLALRATTSNAAAEVSLHPTFEGHFTLQSSLVTPIVHQHEAEDPSGRGRRRYVRFGGVRGLITGDIIWDRESGGGKGEVDVRTSNARAILNV